MLQRTQIVVTAYGVFSSPSSFSRPDEVRMCSLCDVSFLSRSQDWELLAASAKLKLVASPDGSLVWGKSPATMVVMQPI